MWFSKLRNSSKEEFDQEIGQDFERRTIYWSYRPLRYSIYPPFENLKTELDGYLDQILTLGAIDAENKDTLDGLIVIKTRQALAHLDIQKTEHLDAIHTLAVRFLSDKKLFENQLALYRKDLDENLKEQNKLQSLVANKREVESKQNLEQVTQEEVPQTVEVEVIYPDMQMQFQNKENKE